MGKEDSCQQCVCPDCVNEVADELPNYDSSIMDAINAADRFINNQTSLIEEANLKYKDQDEQKEKSKTMRKNK